MIRYVSFHQTRRLQFVVNLNFITPQVVRQHALGVLGYGFCLQFTPLSNGERILKIGLGFDKVIAVSWWSTFWGYSVFMWSSKV